MPAPIDPETIYTKQTCIGEWHVPCCCWIYVECQSLKLVFVTQVGEVLEESTKGKSRIHFSMVIELSTDIITKIV